MSIIDLPYGNSKFDSEDLKTYIKVSSRPYIIQGQKACKRNEHTKPKSLDCWLRDNYAQNPDTKQAVNDVIVALVGTGDFAEGKFICPDSGYKCKGIRLI